MSKQCQFALLRLAATSQDQPSGCRRVAPLPRQSSNGPDHERPYQVTYYRQHKNTLIPTQARRVSYTKRHFLHQSISIFHHRLSPPTAHTFAIENPTVIQKLPSMKIHTKHGCCVDVVVERRQRTFYEFYVWSCLVVEVDCEERS